MSSVDRAVENQLRNIEVRTGKSLDELSAMVGQSGATRHGEIRSWLKNELGMGHGDANAIAGYVLKAGSVAPTGDALDSIYAGGKAHLRPIHERLMAAVAAFGPFEVAPKKANVSLRRRKQFAMIGPASNSRVEVGLNVKGLEPTDRLIAMAAGGMCQYKVNVTAADDVDPELVAWIRQAYDSAG